MSSNYMYPTIISLENLDFEKLDILPGTAKFAVADFAILNAGSIYDLSITVDRYGQNLTKSCSGLVFSESNIETKFAEDVSGTSSITGILDNGLTLSNEMMHQNIIQPTSNFDSVLKGILFAKMVHSVFDMDNGTIKSYDFTDPSKRNESIFFDNDQTLNVANNIKYQTVGLDSSGNGNSVDDSGNIVYFDSAFNQTITNWYGVSGESILNSEVEYWNARTGLDLSGNHTETGVIPFNPDDKLMVMYSISTTFKQPNNDFHGKFSVNVANLPAFVTTSTNSVVDDTMVLRPGIGDSSFESRFILEYNVNPEIFYLTGHKFLAGDDATGLAWNDREAGLRKAVDDWITGDWDVSGGGHISTWDTSEITDFSYLFFAGTNSGPSKLNFNEDISHWDVSSATSMNQMFRDCAVFNQNLNKWNTSRLQDASYMFYDTAFNQDIGDWDVSSVTDFSYMLRYTPFNQDISGWDTTSVNIISGMYLNTPLQPQESGVRHDYRAPNTFNQINDSRSPLSLAVDDWIADSETATAVHGHISTWDTSVVTDFDNVFYGKSAFNEDISNWDLSNATSMYYMFYGAASFNQDISNWDVSKVTDMMGMFNEAYSFNRPLNDWNVSSVTNMDSLFRGIWGEITSGTWGVVSAFNQPLDAWDVSSVTSMKNMFDRAASFNQPLNDWNVSSVTAMSIMFSQAESFNQPLNDWDVSKVTSLDSMFNNASSFNGDVTTWDLSSCSSMTSVFKHTGVDAGRFNQDIGGWDVSYVTNMGNMFYGATDFNRDIGDWNVSSVTSFYYTFYTASSFNQDLSDWVMKDGADVRGMYDDSPMENNNSYKAPGTF